MSFKLLICSLLLAQLAVFEYPVFAIEKSDKSGVSSVADAPEHHHGRVLRESGKALSPQPAATETAPRKHSPYVRRGMTEGARSFYQRTTGIEKLVVRRIASGDLVRFSFRVTDPEKARVILDKNNEALLVDPADHVALKVPVMEKVGPMRQTGEPVAGREYWMAFSNKGNFVKAGDAVDIVIGTFHAEGLIVE